VAKPLIAIFKVGDQETAPGKEHLGMRDGMLVCYIDPNEWPEGANLSAHMQKVFACVEVPYEWKADLVEGCRPTYEGDDPKQIDPKTYGVRRKKVDFSALSTAVVDPSLEASLRNDTVVPLIDAKAAPKAILKEWDAAAAEAPRTLDRNSISSGSYGVGSGDDYSTWAAAFADVANLAGALTFTQSSDVTETAGTPITEDFGGYNLTITSDTPPAGDPTAGHVTSINANVRWYYENGTAGTHTVTIDGIYLKTVATATYPLIHMNNASGNTLAQVRNCMCDHNGKATRFYQNQVTSITPQIFNCVVWGSTSTSGMIYIFNKGTGGTDNVIENCTIYDNGSAEGIDAGNRDIIIRNCACFGNAIDFAQIGNSTGYNNSASDATNANGNWSAGSGNLDSQTAADCFLSLDDTNANFLKPDPAGALAGAGTLTILADNTTGIEGNPRPNADGTVTIGAGEVLGGGYSRQNLFGQRFGQLHGQGV